MADNEHPAYVPGSWLWNHLIQIGENGNKIQCKYCNKFWIKAHLGRSTSTLRSHLVKHHYDKLYVNN